MVKASENLVAQLSVENYGKFSVVLIGMPNNLDFSYITLPIQKYDDVNALVINRIPRDKNPKLSGYSRTSNSRYREVLLGSKYQQELIIHRGLGRSHVL